MPNIEVGREIGVRCDLAPGPFSDQFLVTFETISGPISGFVSKDNVVMGQENYLRAIVTSVETDVLIVWINGSFFTTTGLAQIPPHIAASLQ